MRRMIRRMIEILLCLAVVSGAQAATTAQIDSARVNGLAWLIMNQNRNGSWGQVEGTEVPTTAAALEAMRRAGVKGPVYAAGVAWLGNAEAKSTDALSRQVFALKKAGVNVGTLTSSGSLTNRLNGRRNVISRAWGAYDRHGASLPDTALVLDAVKATASTYAEISSTLSLILKKRDRLNGGGWAYGGWDWSEAAPKPLGQVLPTAYSILTLNTFKVQSPTVPIYNDQWAEVGTYTVQAELDEAVIWLKLQQTPGGGFGDGSSGTVYETALAYQAMTAEKTSAVSAQDYLISQQLVDGSWTGDPFQTALVLQTFPTPSPSLPDLDGDGTPDAVETLVGTDPSRADSYWTLVGAGQPLPVAQPFLAEAVVNQTIVYSVTGTGGVPPYTWRLVSGSLPGGVTFTSGGSLVGTPTGLGIHSFSYVLTDSVSRSSTSVGRLAVVSYTTDSDSDGMPAGFELANGLNPLDSHDADQDADGDGLTNFAEYLWGTNPRALDTDGDGMPDGFEVSHGLNPADAADGSADPDGDGLTNTAEYQWGTKIDDPDTDRDGLCDGCEVNAGRNPLVNEGALMVIINMILDN